MGAGWRSILLMGGGLVCSLALMSCAFGVWVRLGRRARYANWERREGGPRPFPADYNVPTSLVRVDNNTLRRNDSEGSSPSRLSILGRLVSKVRRGGSSGSAVEMTPRPGEDSTGSAADVEHHGES